MITKLDVFRVKWAIISGARQTRRFPAVGAIGNTLPGKPHRRPAVLIKAVEQLHQPIAVFARRRVVKQAELCHAFAGEIAQHHAAAMITVAGDEDPFERPPGGLNDVTAVLGGRRQSGGRLIAVIGLADGERTGGHEHRDVPAELMFAAQLLCRALGMCADRLADAVQLGGLVAGQRPTLPLPARGSSGGADAPAHSGHCARSWRRSWPVWPASWSARSRRRPSGGCGALPLLLATGCQETPTARPGYRSNSRKPHRWSRAPVAASAGQG